MRSLGSSGVWELFIPGLGVGTRYKFEVLGRDGYWREKADPMAFATEVPPATASVVAESRYTWDDSDWMTARARHDPHGGPMSIYEVHLGSWRQGLSYRELADQLTAYVTRWGSARRVHAGRTPSAGRGATSDVVLRANGNSAVP
jgi:1,4-alpha-glucan branching enzyme